VFSCSLKRNVGFIGNRVLPFNSLTFVLFFSLFYLVYGRIRGSLQTTFLLLASYLFYAWWDIRFLGLILITTLVDYIVGLGMQHVQRLYVRRLLLSMSLVTNLSILFIFKYFDFFAANLWRIFSLFGFQLDRLTLHVFLPIGISFYTFRSLTYTIDIYRNEIRPTRSLLNYAVFVSFFPELIAGPIERAGRFLPQIAASRAITYPAICEGAWCILLGFFKKDVVADNMAVIADAEIG